MKKNNEPDIEELLQKHESDLTQKEKRLIERYKLKDMDWKGRIWYFWTYYKLVLAVLLGVIFVICLGVEIYQNKQKIELVSVAVTDTTVDAETIKESMEADLLNYMGTGDRHEMITLDTNVMSGDDYTSSMKRSVILSAGTTDILICGSDLYEEYKDAFISAEDFLGDSYSDYEEYLTDGGLDLSKSEKWKSYGLTDYEPVYLGVLVNAKNTENALKFAEYFFKDNA